MKKIMTVFGAIIFASFILTSCGNSMTAQEMNREMSKCK